MSNRRKTRAAGAPRWTAAAGLTPWVRGRLATVSGRLDQVDHCPHARTDRGEFVVSLHGPRLACRDCDPFRRGPECCRCGGPAPRKLLIVPMEEQRIVVTGWLCIPCHDDEAARTRPEGIAR